MIPNVWRRAETAKPDKFQKYMMFQLHKWGLPKWWYPQNHAFFHGIFHSKPTSYWGTPSYGNLHIIIIVGALMKLNRWTQTLVIGKPSICDAIF